MRAAWVERIVIWLGAIVVAGGVAVTTYGIGLIQGRYDIGAPGWVEGGFGWVYLVAGAVVSVFALGLAAFLGHGARRDLPGRVRRALRGLLVLAVMALWAGYAGGWGTAALEGPMVHRPGTVRFALGPPTSASFEAAATCTSVVGDGNLLAEVHPRDEQVPVVSLRNPVSRTASPTIVQLDDQRSFVIPGGHPPSIGPYDWTMRALDEHPDSGRMVASGVRWGDGTGPLSIDVEVTWTCERTSH